MLIALSVPLWPLGVPFPKNFQQVCTKILTRLFRVFVHVYIHHFDSILSMGAEAHVNTCYKHFYYFVTEFGLIDTKELEPLVSGGWAVTRHTHPSSGNLGLRQEGRKFEPSLGNLVTWGTLPHKPRGPRGSSGQWPCSQPSGRRKERKNFQEQPACCPRALCSPSCGRPGVHRVPEQGRHPNGHSALLPHQTADTPNPGPPKQPRPPPAFPDPRVQAWASRCPAASPLDCEEPLFCSLWLWLFLRQGLAV